MGKFRWIQTVLILIVAGVVAYRAYQLWPDRVASDFVQFSNKVLTPALDLMPQTARYLAAKTDTAKAEAYAKDFVPIYAEKVQRLQSSHPQTPEVQHLRQQYLDSFQTTLRGYLDFTQAVDKKDPSKFASSAHAFIAGRTMLSQAQQTGLALMKAHHLQFESRRK